MLMAIVANTYSKYGINTYISIYFFCLRQYLHVKLTMKRFGHLWANVSKKIFCTCHKCLTSNPKSYFTLYKRHLELKHKHHYGSLSHLVRYVFLVIVGFGYKFVGFTHIHELPDSDWYGFSQHSSPRGGGGGGGGEAAGIICCLKKTF